MEKKGVTEQVECDEQTWMWTLTEDGQSISADSSCTFRAVFARAENHCRPTAWQRQAKFQTILLFLISFLLFWQTAT